MKRMERSEVYFCIVVVVISLLALARASAFHILILYPKSVRIAKGREATLSNA